MAQGAQGGWKLSLREPAWVGVEGHGFVRWAPGTRGSMFLCSKAFPKSETDVNPLEVFPALGRRAYQPPPYRSPSMPGSGPQSSTPRTLTSQR